MEIQCSASEFREGMKSKFWSDVRNQLEAWKEDLRDAMEDSDGALSDKETHVLQGSIKAVRYVLMLPEQMLKDIEEGATEI